MPKEIFYRRCLAAFHVRLLMVLVVCGGCSPLMATPLQELFAMEWATSMDGRLTIQSPNRESISSGYFAAMGGPAMKACLNRRDDFTRVNGVPRAEVAFARFPRFAVGHEYEISWSTYIPPGYQFDHLQPEIITQIHQGVDYGSPPFSLMLIGGHYRVESRGGIGTSARSFEFGRLEDDIGAKVLWTLRYRPHPSGKGAFTELYRNGQLVVRDVGKPNAYPGEQSAYLKMGLYKWWWKSRPSEVNVRCIYYGPVKVSSGDAK